jgi:hypothetical protein
MKTHLNPKPLIIAERFRFHKRDQQENESVAQFVAAVKKLTKHCEFGLFRDDAIRDRIVCGLRSQNMQKRLISEKALTCDRAITLAVALEAAEHDVTELNSGLTSVSTNKVKFSKKAVNSKKAQSDKSGDKIVCYCCGRNNHKRPECRFKDQKCTKCNLKGHLEVMCGKIPLNRRPKKSTKHVTVETSGDVSGSDSDPSFSNVNVVDLHGLRGDTVKRKSDAWQINAKLQGFDLKFELDCGSAMTIIPRKWYDKYFKGLKLENTNLILSTWTNEEVSPLGLITIEVDYKGEIKLLKAIVDSNNRQPLFGREWIEAFKIDWREVFSCKQKSPCNNENLD